MTDATGYAITDIGNETAITVVQEALLVNASNYTTQTYSLSDTWAHISNVANATVVADATTYAISDITSKDGAALSVADATLLTGASNVTDFAGAECAYSLTDTWTNIQNATSAVWDYESTYNISDITSKAGATLSMDDAMFLIYSSNYVTDFVGVGDTYSLSDTWSSITWGYDQVGYSGAVTSAASYDISDITSKDGAALSVADATLLTGASNYSDFTGANDTYTLTDTIANIGDVANEVVVNGATTYTLTDTWANISNADNAAVVTDATGYAITGIANETEITVVQADLLVNASNHTTQTYSLSDTWANISNADNAAVVTDATGYAITDIAAEDEQALTIAQANALTDASNYMADFNDIGDTFTLSADTWANIGATANTDIIGLAASYVATITGIFTGDVTKDAGLTTMTLTASSDGWAINASNVDTLDLVGATILNESYSGTTETIEFTDANTVHQIITLTGVTTEMTVAGGHLIVV